MYFSGVLHGFYCVRRQPSPKLIPFVKAQINMLPNVNFYIQMVKLFWLTDLWRITFSHFAQTLDMLKPNILNEL